MSTINQYLSGAVVPVLLLSFAVAFLIKLKARPLLHPIMMMKKMLVAKRSSGASSVRAVILALAGTLGVGNIVGVASAIALGGAGAVFWMWISAFLAMILKYSEVVLGILHRRARDGAYYGGAMYYMTDFFNSCKKDGIGMIYSFVFTVFCLLNGFTMGCIIQSNAIAESFESTFGVKNIIIGAILATLSICVFFFNAKRIFSLCEKLVPLVSAIYVIMSLVVIILECERLPDIISEIITGAFKIESAVAGGTGFLVSKALRYGTIRGLFSNEAGCGTSPIAHATSDTDSPCEQGFLGILEVFIDTIIVCTMTAFVILLNKESAFEHMASPIEMALSGFSATLGDVSEVLFAISVFLFAFATIACWGYYGKECIYFIGKSKKLEKGYYCVYVLCIFCGSFMHLDFVWELADLAVGVMTVMNLIILGGMSREIKCETDSYYKKELPKGSSDAI